MLQREIFPLNHPKVLEHNITLFTIYYKKYNTNTTNISPTRTSPLNKIKTQDSSPIHNDSTHIHIHKRI